MLPTSINFGSILISPFVNSTIKPQYSFITLLAFFAFRRYIFFLKLYDFITQAVKSVHKIQAAFLIKFTAYMVERIIIETLNKRIKFILHLQIDNNIGILFKIDRPASAKLLLLTVRLPTKKPEAVLFFCVYHLPAL